VYTEVVEEVEEHAHGDLAQVEMAFTVEVMVGEQTIYLLLEQIILEVAVVASGLPSTELIQVVQAW
jgi:hypothetical protein